jgi:hypothetical protein
MRYFSQAGSARRNRRKLRLPLITRRAGRERILKVISWMFLYIKYFPGKIDPTGTRIYGLGFGNGAGPKTSGGETAWEIYERWPE